MTSFYSSYVWFSCYVCNVLILFPVYGQSSSPLFNAEGSGSEEAAAAGIARDEACGPGKFSCGTSPRDRCLPQKLWCNEVRDCLNGADEVIENCIDNEGYHSWLLSSHLFNRPYIDETKKRGRNECVLTSYPAECLCQWYTRLDCRGRGFTSIPRTSIHLTKIMLQNNPLSQVYQDSFAGYPNLEFIQMKNCSIHRLDPNVFDDLERLRIIYLDNNHLEHLPNKLLANQQSLQWLFLQDNELSDWQEGLFNIIHEYSFVDANTSSESVFDPGLQSHPVVWFNLTSNRLKFERPGMFTGAQQLSILEAGNNQITQPHKDIFKNLTKLGILLLHNNQIESLPDEIFDDLHSLTELDLSNNQLRAVSRRHFKNTNRLAKLSLARNPLTAIEVDFLADLPNLLSLDLAGIEIPNIQIAMFERNKKLSFIYFKSFASCSLAPHVRVCKPNTDGISSMTDLLSSPVLRVAVWLMAAATCMFNLVVIVSRLLLRDTNISVLFICSLSAADLVMGIYLLIIAAHDVHFRDKYNSFAHAWMSSGTCRVTGFLAMLSSEVTIIILAYMSVERFVVIVCPFGGRPLSRKTVLWSLAAVWLVGILLACVPMWSDEVFGSFYGTNGMCFPLHIHEPYMRGWEYSAFVFLGINTLSIVTVTVCYLGMFISVYITERASSRIKMDKEKSLAKRIFAIVVTDALCWIPIIVVKILALSNVNISGDLYAWLAVFALPINSSINPILYTLTTNVFLHRINKTLLYIPIFASLARRRSSSSALQCSLKSLNKNNVSCDHDSSMHVVNHGRAGGSSSLIPHIRIAAPSEGDCSVDTADGKSAETTYTFPVMSNDHAQPQSSTIVDVAPVIVVEGSNELNKMQQLQRDSEQQYSTDGDTDCGTGLTAHSDSTDRSYHHIDGQHYAPSGKPEPHDTANVVSNSTFPTNCVIERNHADVAL